MPIQQSFITRSKETLETTSDDEFILLSELLERAFSRNVKVALAESQHERHGFESAEDAMHR